jgi:outer membrane murein-binding lipoprotein Lpp
VRGRRLLFGAVLAGTLVVAGCGGTKSYDAEKTRSCLADQPGVKLSNKVDSLPRRRSAARSTRSCWARSRLLAEDRKEAERIVRAYQRFRGKNIGLTDVLRPSHNVVALWEAHPSETAVQTIEDCLK